MSSNITSPPDTAAETAALEDLAARLDREKFVVSVVGNTGKRACLRVSNRHAGALAEVVYCIDGWYRWSWGDKIGNCADLDHVAKMITHVLKIVGPS